MKVDCDLCVLERRSEWLDDTNSKYVIIRCDQCDFVMGVWRAHEMNISEDDKAELRQAMTYWAKKIHPTEDFFIDEVQRTIFDHLHFHARPMSSQPWRKLLSKL